MRAQSMASTDPLDPLHPGRPTLDTDPASNDAPGEAADPGPPSWVRDWAADRQTRHGHGRRGLPPADVLDLRGARLLHVSVPAIRPMDILTFQQAVADAYRAIFDRLEASGPAHPVRLWAFVP